MKDSHCAGGKNDVRGAEVVGQVLAVCWEAEVG